MWRLSTQKRRKESPHPAKKKAVDLDPDAFEVRQNESNRRRQKESAPPRIRNLPDPNSIRIAERAQAEGQQPRAHTRAAKEPPATLKGPGRLGVLGCVRQIEESAVEPPLPSHANRVPAGEFRLGRITSERRALEAEAVKLRPAVDEDGHEEYQKPPLGEMPDLIHQLLENLPSVDGRPRSKRGPLFVEPKRRRA
jgi:hypothetical protein